jgi:uncharacterized cofD-like protein
MRLQDLASSIGRFFRRQSLRRGQRIVAVGGGTGLPVLLRGLKKYTSNITAIVTAADDGGSSGRLRGDFGILPPGDIRNCLAALAETEMLMEKLFQYRFGQGDGLAGHSLGNLLITALVDITGDFKTAIKELSHVLNVRGQVLPSTMEQVTLSAELADGSHVFGQSRIAKVDVPIKSIFLTPALCKAVPEAIRAIEHADMILLGPGSLFTSVIPNLLVPDISAAINHSHAVKCYICNIMTQPGETTNFKASDHLNAIYTYTGVKCVDYILVNNKSVDKVKSEKYALEGARSVIVDQHTLQKMGVRVLGGDFLNEQELVRHDSQKLARFIFSRLI